MHFLQDIRFAGRSFLKTPGVTIAAVLSVALGIAATTSVFTFVNAMLFRPMPVPHPDQLVALYTTEPDARYPSSFSFPEYREYRDNASGLFSDLFAYNNQSLGFSANGEKAELIWSEIVTGNYFTGLGVTPAAGRVLTPADDRIRGAHPVVVLAHAFWQRRFGGDPSIVGKTVKLTGHDFTVVGVAREGFSGTRLAGFIPDLWVPFSMIAEVTPHMNDVIEDRGNRAFDVNGRLAPGVTIDRATASLNVVAERLARDYPKTNARMGVGMVPAGNKTQPAITLLGYIPIAARTMLAVAMLVLLIACGSVANLFLARASTRRREIAMRLACGAPRRRIIGQLLTESLIVAACGGAAGLLLARWFNLFIPLLVPPLDFATMDLAYDLALDYRVLSFTASITIITGIAFGLVPALQASRVDLLTVLRARDANATGVGGGRFNLRNGLVVAQIAFSLALVVGAGMFARSMDGAQQIDPGFETRNVLLASVNVGMRDYSRENGLQFFTRAAERIRALPGVGAASFAFPLPLDAYGSTEVVVPEGYVPRRDNERLEIGFSVVGPDYFRAMGTELVSGRGFSEADTATTPHVVIVNETMARRLWPNQPVLGKRMHIGYNASSPQAQVVGVARDGKYNLLGEPPTEYFFMPFAQHYRGTATMIARTSGSPAALAAAVQREIAALDPGVPIYGVKTMPAFLNRLLSLPMSVAVIVAIFALIALVMASVGLYGVVSYSIARRTKEFGVRMAVGAGRGDVMRMVLKSGLALATVGIAIGIVAAVALMRLAASLLFGIGPTDLPTFIAATIVLALVAMVASYVPARRAVRLDPTIALRYE
jgi:predicted permease